ncbi:MAG: TRAP transporter large permease subunit [Nitrospirae bacterium]|nr:TRAP transporter large permease subunit [Nitrospirota bacterium]
MTPQIAFLFALLAVMVYLFLTEKLPVDLTAFLGLITLIFTGYLTPSEAFTGFSSPAVITMLSVFIVGAALLATGVADVIGSRIHRLVGNSETRLIVVLMLTCGILSAFMNNIAATAVLMPAVATIAHRTGLSPSRLFMPLAFGAILGGTTTLIGTPPNILAAQMLDERGLEPFSLFDFAPMGLALLALGVVYMLTIGRKLLPAGEQHGPAQAESRDLTQVYQLKQHLFSIRLPEDTPLDGMTLAETRLGNTLGIKVLSIQRGDRRRTVPRVLHGGDVLTVDGLATDLGELLRMQNLEIEKIRVAELPSPVRGVGGVRARVLAGSPLIGFNLKELSFRDRFGLVVVGVRRGEQLQGVELAEWVLQADDEIFALGAKERLESLSRHPDFEVLQTGLTAIRDLVSQLHLVRIPEGSPLVNTSIQESRLGELVGLTVAGLIREGETHLAVSPNEVLRVDDRLLIGGGPERLVTLADLGEVQFEKELEEAPLESEEIGMVEAALAPRSAAIGRTLADLNFQSRYGLIALALWREGQPHHVDFSHVPLRLGDALLLHGPRQKIRELAAEPDFVVLSQADQAPRRLSKAPWAFGALLLMIGLVVTGAQPIHVAAFTAASLAILFGALTMQEAYRAIEWKAIFLVAAVLPVGLAMERTGAAMFLADGVTNLAGPLGNHVTLAALIVLASMLSQGLDGAPTVVLLAPVVIDAANNLGISPYPLMMGVSLAASAAFMTPFSHKANLLVMGAGGYRSRDYLRVGTPLTLVIFVVLTFLVPVFFPF